MNYNSPKAVSPQGEYIHIVGNVEDYLGAKYGRMRVDGCGEKGRTMVDLPWVEPQPGPFLRIEYIHSVAFPERSIYARSGPNWVGGRRDMGLTSAPRAAITTGQHSFQGHLRKLSIYIMF